ncbi:MAG: hypothetical protein R3C59_28610 [Planctomycetaceae bacterium]
MPALIRSRLTAVILLLIIPISTAGRLQAQSDDDAPKPVFGTGTKPFVVLTAASANQLKDKAHFIFETAEMPDIVDSILQKLDENVNGLQGLNWERPAGIMVFLNSVLPPSSEFVAFLPVSSPEEFQAMMETGPVVMREEPNEPGRYELISPRRNIQIRIQNDYAFIQLPPMDPDPAFDRDLPDVTNLVAAQARQFDVSVTLDVEAVPKPTRDLLFNMLASMMSTQHQQRDEEPDAVYAVRDAWQQRDIAGLKLVFQDTQRITIGLGVDVESNGANLDLLLDARAASDLLSEIFMSATKPSYFTPLVSDDAPLSVSYSNLLAERDRKGFADSLEAAKGLVAKTIEDQDLGDIPTEGSPLFNALTALRETAQEGHLDMFAQFYRDSEEKLAVVAAFRVQDGEAVASGIQDLLMRLQGRDTIGDIEIGADEHAGITFHELEFRNPDAGALELFGSHPGVRFGAGSRSLWICVGGDASFDTLTGVMDQLQAAYENPIEREIPASVRVVLNFTEFKNLLDAAGNAKREARRAQAEEEAAPTKQPQPLALAPAEGERRGGRGGQRNREQREADGRLILETLAEGNDRIQIDFRPTDKGMRLRAHFDMAFVKAIGRVIGSRIAGEN